MSFKPGVKGRGSDRWWERCWGLWWGDMRRVHQEYIAVSKHIENMRYWQRR